MPVPVYITEQREREVQQALRLLRALPHLVSGDVFCDDACPVCLIPLSTILDEDKSTHEREQEGILVQSPSSQDEGMAGVVKLSGCGHVFCRRDLAEWIGSHHGSCPTCRQTFFVFTPLDEAEYESSDGGEYVPGEDDEDDDAFTDDGDLDLLPTSDFDTDVDVDLDMLDDGEDHTSATNTIGFPGSDFRIFAEDGDIELDDDELDSDYIEEDENAHSDGSSLSYSSDSLSSEGASVSTENDGAELYVTDVGMVADNEYTSEDEIEAPSEDGCTEVKSPGPSPMEQPQHTRITQ